MPSLKPVLYGYLTVPVNAPRETLARGQRVLQEYAQREHYALGTVFIERSTNRPLTALSSLIEAANRDDIRVMAVPTATDLGSLPGVRQLLRQMLDREASVRVIIVEPSA